jgi:hypothetical protein
MWTTTTQSIKYRILYKMHVTGLSNKLWPILIAFGTISFFVSAFQLTCYDSHHFKGLNSTNDNTFVKKYFNRLFFVLLTLTTIGSSDIMPATFRAKIVTAIVILIVFAIIIKAFDALFKSYGTYVAEIISRVRQVGVGSAPHDGLRDP